MHIPMRSTPIHTPIQGDICVPGDKSISHRALMLAAITPGITHIKHCLHSEDCVATGRILNQMGVRIEWLKGEAIVEGVGLYGLTAPRELLDCGNSGTTMRLLSGILVGQAFDSILIGDESLSKRPMMRMITPLRQMGANIEGTNGCAPIQIKGKRNLKSINYKLPIASAQVKSCILLAGLYAKGETSVTEAIVTRDHTERMLSFFMHKEYARNNFCISNSRTRFSSNNSHLKCRNYFMHIPNGDKARQFQVPGDLSSAAFFMVVASLVPESDLIIREVGINPTRTGILDILSAMGADITLKAVRLLGNEPVADIQVRHALLKGVSISKTMLTRAIDEFPILLIAAACAKGQTQFDGIEELRYKESDRVQVMTDGLKTLGIKVIIDGERLIVEGGGLEGGTVDACFDHRVAMAFGCAGAISKNPIFVLNASKISTSFPTFVTIANQIGMCMK